MYEGYTALKNGTVLGKRGTPLNPQLHKGYLHIVVSTHKVPVHRVIATQLIPNPENKAEIHHIDGNRLNNAVENLMWVTRAEHRELHKYELNKLSKLNWEIVDYIREHIDVSTNDLAAQFNVSAAAISLVKHNKSWKIEQHP